MATEEGTGVEALVSAARAGAPRALARLLSYLESRADLLPEVLARLPAPDHPAQVIGVTGAPGVGKSTTVSALVRRYRDAGRRVAVLAVDPTSPFSGGALLGDRVRMQEHAADAGVFVRSMATRGRLGGLAWTTPAAVRLLESVGFDVVLVETVGVGQSEIDVAAASDTTLVLLAPGMGDGIQAAKAGVLEVADVFVVNKADREGADEVRRDLLGVVRAVGHQAHDWRVPVVPISARTEEGMVELLTAIEGHARWLDETGHRGVRRLERARREVEAAVTSRVLGGLRTGPSASRFADLVQRVAAGALDAQSAADMLVRDEPNDSSS